MKKYIFLVTKIFLLLAFVLLVAFQTNSLQIAAMSSLEIFAIFCLQGILPARNRIFIVAKYLLTSILLLLSLANLTVYLFSRTYLSYLMTSNAENLGAIHQGMPAYITAIVYIVLAAFFPIRVKKLERSSYFFAVLFVLPFCAWIALNSYGKLHSPLFAYSSYIAEVEKMSEIRSTKISSKEIQKISKEFYRSEITSSVTTKHPSMNIILIFTEGLSSEVLEHNQGKLTPNLNQFATESVNFSDYFNQTAATYKGVRGQLYSSQQFDNGFENGSSMIKQNLKTPLSSVQSILAASGYQTDFFNAEPHETTWTSYVDNLGFQKILTGKTPTNDKSSYVSDSENYQLLLSNAEKLSKSDKPFLLTSYTFGTHLSLNSNVHYADGSNSLLNKFYGMDKSFGEFWTAFQKSSLSKNTMVIFTADHATFPDPQFQSTFNTSRSYFISTIPLFIHYPGVKPQTINVGGRNSLGLAPTILDLVGLSKAGNYFLGNSLFGEKVSPYEYVTDLSPAYYSTKGITEAQLKSNQDLTARDVKPLKKLQDFYKLSLNENQ